MVADWRAVWIVSYVAGLLADWKYWTDRLSSQMALDWLAIWLIDFLSGWLSDWIDLDSLIG